MKKALMVVLIMFLYGCTTTPVIELRKDTYPRYLKLTLPAFQVQESIAVIYNLEGSYAEELARKRAANHCDKMGKDEEVIHVDFERHGGVVTPPIETAIVIFRCIPRTQD